MIYFIKELGTQAIKIGFSKTPKERIGGLQTGNPHKLLLLGMVRGTPNDEAAFHGKFSQHRMEGEWFKGDIIEEVLEIIATHTQNKLKIRRKTVTEDTGDQGKGEGGPPPESATDEKSVLSADTGVQGVCRIPGLRMKSFTMTLTERQQELPGVTRSSRMPNTVCGVQVKYLLVFEKDFTKDEGGRTELAKMQTAICGQGLKHSFFDGDNAVIPLYPRPPNASCYHVVGGPEAFTGAEGDAVRVLLVFERELDPNHHMTMMKGVFTGENYTGEHPLKNAKKLAVSLR